MRQTDRQWIQQWEEFTDNIRNSTAFTVTETEKEKRQRIARLEADPEEWFKFYFPNYCFAPAAAFHKRSFKKVLNAFQSSTKKGLYQVRPWSRGLSKSTRRMMEVFYLTLAKKHPTNLLLISKSESNAIRLLQPYRGNLEANQRIINDYGVQMKTGSWKEEEFVTRKKASFRAVGREQSPRGSRLDEIRPNILVFDDVDDDELCQNPDRVDNCWQWIEKAVIPTVEISKTYFIFFDGNIIAENCTINRAIGMADDYEIVNIRNEEGKSSWPEKNSEADIDNMLAKISFNAAQSEYFNNPVTEGKVFKEIIWGEVPPLNVFPFLVSYADPATSNADKAVGKQKQNSYKAVVLMGKAGLKYYILNCFLDHANNSEFTDWLYQMEKNVGSHAALYTYIENNTLQDPFYQQVFLPLFYERGKKEGHVISIIPDGRKKPEKFFRIEGTLEPLNRLGLLIFNQNEKDNPHMRRLEAQFKSVSPKSKVMDGPDAVEGAVTIIKEKESLFATAQLHTVRRKSLSKKW